MIKNNFGAFDFDVAVIKVDQDVMNEFQLYENDHFYNKISAIR